MFITVPILLNELTEVEGINGEEFVDYGDVNPDHIAFYHPDKDPKMTVLITSYGGTILVCLNINDFRALLDQYEITIYNN